MQRNIRRNLLFVVSAVLLIGTSLIAVHLSARADLNQRVTLKGQFAPLVQQAHLLQAADANQQLNLSIGLKIRNQADLDSLLQAMYDPQSAQYHQYLTPDQFNQLFAPTSDQVQQVVSFLQSQGLAVTGIAPNNLLIDATGIVAQVQKAFDTQINTYQSGNHTFYANATAPSIPGSINQLITSISGLDNSVQYYPLYQRAHMYPQAIHAQYTQQHSIQRRLITHLAGPGSGYGPKDLAGAYNISQLQNAGNLGDNQTVALFELDGYQSSDVVQYLQNYNLGNPSITNVLVDGFNGSAGPGANDTYNKIVTDNKAQVVSTSWGLCETSSGVPELQTLDTIFKQGAAQGISFFAASGDSGAYDCSDTNLAVDSPASDPYVTGVGGTNLQLNAGAYGSESVWSNPNSTTRGPKGAGGGGGLSNTFKQPSWQTGPGVQNPYSNGFREVPDVTGDADPATGYAMYCTVTNAGCPSTGWISVGGTSAAAPLWAGITALINQYLQAQGKKVIGYANPALYALFNAHPQFPAFHDITTGNNLNYPAVTGYDLASGIGSPDVYNMARDFVTLSVGGTPTPTPTSTPTPNPTPNPSPTPTNTPTPPPLLIQNGDFENGQAPWQESSTKGYQLVDPSNSNTGQNSAYFCGYPGCNDRLWQSFTVPANYTKIMVTYWWYSDTNKTVKQCLDNFVSQLQSSTGTPIRIMQQNCNTNVTNNWVQESFDVSSSLAGYKGKQVTLFFRATNAPGLPQTSDFFVDSVVITVQ
ncbi:MAG: peptidase S53 [Chloroflexi bacterium]|nr:MAG: peptidase S53 [Chloroflexota bacterium]